MELMLGVLLVVVGPLILAQIVLAIGAGIHRMSNSGTNRQTKDIDEGLSLDYLWLQRLNNTLDGNKKPSKKRNY